METYLSNSLGILIAFATLMLVFSLLVTSLVQATQSILRLRARNLWRGLTKILEQENDQFPSDNAFKVLANSAPAVFSVVKNPGNFIKKFFGPEVSWLDANQLDAALRKCEVTFSEGQIDNIVAQFDATQKTSSKRFQFWVGVLTVVWSVVIVAHFQLSTPELLTRLSADPEYRELLIKEAETFAKSELDSGAAKGQVQDAKPKVQTDAEPQDVPKKGSDLATNEQARKDKLEKQAIFYFPRDPERSFLFAADSAARLGFKVLWADVPGAVLTVLLLSLGAPFWFNSLKTLVNLKDVLAKDKGKDTDEKESDNANKPDIADVNKQIDEVKQSIAKSADPLEQTALKARLGDLRVLKVKMRNV